MNEDPFELNDVSKAHPENVSELEEKWNVWAEKNQVLPLNSKGLTWNKCVEKYTKLYPIQDGRD